MRNKIGSVLWGLAFILVGAGVAGNILNFWSFDLFFNGWWTLFIIIPCAISIIQHGFNTGNSIGLAIGILLLLGAQNIISGRITAKMFLPALLVIIGLSIIFRPAYRPGKANYQNGYASSSGNSEGTAHKQYTYDASKKWNSSCGNDIVAIFCGNNGSFSGREFKGASCTAVFGGVELDLRGAQITSNVTVDATAVFGGVEIFTDDHVQVVYRSVPIFGGVDCSVPTRDTSMPTVFCNCVAIFGGVDIK